MGDVVQFPLALMVYEAKKDAYLAHSEFDELTFNRFVKPKSTRCVRNGI